jgi:hypothetical protein
MAFCNGSTKKQHYTSCKFRKKLDGDPGNDQTSVARRKLEPNAECPSLS